MVRVRTTAQKKMWPSRDAALLEVDSWNVAGSNV